VIGSKIIDKLLGTEYNSIAAFVRAIQHRDNTSLVLNPKIITEDSVPAEIFVGINTSFQTQAIANVGGTVATRNFEFRDVGTRLRVTPFLANSDIITLEIAQERSDVLTAGNQDNGGPTTSISKTTTRVHLPNGCFLVLSGLLEDDLRDQRTQVPCLGGIPIVGAAFKGTQYTNAKTNLMLFVRAEIMDTEEELNRLTKNQQGIFNFKKRVKQADVLAVEEALQLLNLKKRPQDDENPEFETFNNFN
jgi:type III secretion protein C